MNYTDDCDYQDVTLGSICYRLDCVREQLDTLIALLTPKAEPKPAEPIMVQVVLDGKTISESVIRCQETGAFLRGDGSWRAQ